MTLSKDTVTVTGVKPLHKPHCGQSGSDMGITQACYHRAENGAREVLLLNPAELFSLVAEMLWETPRG